MDIKNMKIAIGSDHAGFNYKKIIRKHLVDRGFEVKDFGTYSEESVDYPVYIRPVAKSVADGVYQVGIILGGSGNGEAITANKVKGIRCAVCWDHYTARMCKEHNNANLISLGERTVTPAMAVEIVDIWLDAEFQGGRHERRINQIEK